LGYYKQYIFSQRILYPIEVSFHDNTFIDTDYDGVKTATDTMPKFSKLTTFCQSANLLTTLYNTAQYQNINTIDFKSDLNVRYNIDVCDNNSSAKILFALSNHILNTNQNNNQIDILSIADLNINNNEFDNEITNINDFFDNQLSSVNTPVEYYSLYNSLLNLDKKIYTRADTLNTPLLPTVLKSSLVVENSFTVNSNNNSIDIFDIKMIDDNVYTASGHEILDIFNTELTTLTNIENTDKITESFGSRLYGQEYNSNKCLFVANGLGGVATYNITDDGVYVQDILSYTTQEAPSENLYFTQAGGVSSVNGYVSTEETKRLLSIGTKDNGFYLINIKDNILDCTVQPKGIISSEFLIEETAGHTISSAINDDGTYLYITNKNNIITKYDIHSLNKIDIESSKKEFTLTENTEYYNLFLIDSGNNLFVTTSNGIEIYDINSSDNISFISKYDSEGSEIDYLSQLEYVEYNSNKFLIFTDGFHGVKVLKLDIDLQPKLCGIAYFSLLEKQTERAKVTSIEYNDNNSLYVGLSENGIQKINFDSMLFEHCK
jgi:hypothetical protein